MACGGLHSELVDLGIDILNPIQWRADCMDRQNLKKQYGDRLTFHGAMDNQHTLPFGSVEEVQGEVRENFRILGEGGGYILDPAITSSRSPPSRTF
jgi:uroporphyrinogen decarboxylase